MSETPEDFTARLIAAAEAAETLDVVALGGLTIRQIAAVELAAKETGGVGSFSTTGMTDEAFLFSFMGAKLDDLTADEIAEGHRLLAERRRSREA